jgi:hypothetical protein
VARLDRPSNVNSSKNRFIVAALIRGDSNHKCRATRIT